MKALLVIITGLCTFSMTGLMAQETTYTLDYSVSSPIKDIPLKNAAIKIEIYKSEDPSGYQNVTTDENQSFKLDNNYDLEVVSIADQDKFQADCSGSATSSNPKILITCKPKSSPENTSSKADDLD